MDLSGPNELSRMKSTKWTELDRNATLMWLKRVNQQQMLSFNFRYYRDEVNIRKSLPKLSIKFVEKLENYMKIYHFADSKLKVSKTKHQCDKNLQSTLHNFYLFILFYSILFYFIFVCVCM